MKLSFCILSSVAHQRSRSRPSRQEPVISTGHFVHTGTTHCLGLVRHVNRVVNSSWRVLFSLVKALSNETGTSLHLTGFAKTVRQCVEHAVQWALWRISFRTSGQECRQSAWQYLFASGLGEELEHLQCRFTTSAQERRWSVNN